MSQPLPHCEPDRSIYSITKLLGVSRSTPLHVPAELLPAQRGPAALGAHAPAVVDAELK